MGMTSETLDKVKQAVPYFTTKASSGKSGYGAGTQVLRRLIDFHGGRIMYDSEYNKGTAITIFMPITDRPKEEGNEKI